MSCSQFDRSAAYYDLLYSRKDYSGDSEAYAQALAPARAYGPSLIEWGCGTGNFLAQWSRHGWEPHGVDCSEAMLVLAAKKGLRVHYGSLIGNLPMPRLPKASAAVSPFAVVSYAATDAALLRSTLATMRRFLVRGGRAAFDVLNYAGAAASIRPEDVREITGKLDGRETTIRREMVKLFDADSGLVRIHMKFSVARKMRRWSRDGTTKHLSDDWEETHQLRAISPGEIRLALPLCGLREVSITDLEAGGPVGIDGWYSLVVAEAV